MTETQFKKYQKIKKELEPIKEFLFWCGNKYRHKAVSKYRFKIGVHRKGFSLIRIDPTSTITENRYEIPYELQQRIVETIEQYFEEKEKELEAI